MGGIVVYDVTNPATPDVRDLRQPARLQRGGRTIPASPATSPPRATLGPEGLAFIPFCQSPTLRPLLVVSNEVSGTTTVYQLSGGPF